MGRVDDWNKFEFGALLRSNALSDRELAEQLPDRSSGAVAVVRQGIHSYHLGGDISMLSELMIRMLRQRAGKMKCPICDSLIPE